LLSALAACTDVDPGRIVEPANEQAGDVTDVARQRAYPASFDST
jgi:hypothetical protein